MAETPNTITLIAEESKNLDTVCYRGTAPLEQLTRMSQVDVFDQDTNPSGLQRDLSRKHALDAYDYAAREPDKKAPRAFPEVMLNVRDKKVVNVETTDVEIGEGRLKIASITIDMDAIAAALKRKTVKISRVDGNHRLFFGAGDGKDRPPLDAPVPFSMTIGLNRDQETSIFTDVNAEQKGLNTSHLAYLRARHTPEEIEFERNPARFLALRLVNDEGSPWFGLVHLGGSKAGAKSKGVKRPVNFVALESGVRRILRKAHYLEGVTTIDGKYGLIRNYWQAVRLANPQAWEDGNELLILKNLGVNTLSEFGALVIDRCLIAGEIEVEDMAGLVQHGLSLVDWHRNSPDVAGMSGNRAALALAGRMAEDLPTSGRGIYSPVEVRDNAPDEHAEPQVEVEPEPELVN